MPTLNTTEPYLIEEFRKLGDQPWRISWLGRVEDTSSVTEPKIVVYLSELKHDFIDPMNKDALSEPERHTSVRIKISMIGLLKLGSVWQNGLRQRNREMPSRYKKRPTMPLIIQHNQFDLVQFGKSMTIDGSTAPLLHAGRYRIGLNAAKEVRSSFLAVAFDPCDELRFIVIPSFVLFQTFLATSPKAVRKLVHGELDKIIDPTDWGFIDDQHQTLRVTVFKDFTTRHDAPYLANLLTDEIGNAEYKRFRNALRLQSINADNGPIGVDDIHIKLKLPFSNPVKLTSFVGKYLRVNDDGKKWGFLVTEIESAQVELVFRNLIVQRKNDGTQGQNAKDADLVKAWPTPSKTIIHPEEPTELSSRHDPEDTLAKFYFSESAAMEDPGLTILEKDKDVQRYRSAKVFQPSFDGPFSKGTTGDPTSFKSGLVETDFGQQSTARIPVTLEDFFEALEILKQQGFLFESLAVSRHFRKRDDGHVVNYFDKYISGLRSWHLIDDSEGAPPRGFIVAQIKVGDVWRYFIELERKSDQRSLACIRAKDGSSIDPSHLDRFMKHVAKEKGWKAIKYHQQWKLITIKHRPSKGAKAFAAAIAKVF